MKNSHNKDKTRNFKISLGLYAHDNQPVIVPQLYHLGHHETSQYLMSIHIWGLQEIETGH